MCRGSGKHWVELTARKVWATSCQLSHSTRCSQCGKMASPAVLAKRWKLCCRWLGGDKVPEYWGKPSPYTEGTAFLGTPTNHDQVCHRAQLHPHHSRLLVELCTASESAFQHLPAPFSIVPAVALSGSAMNRDAICRYMQLCTACVCTVPWFGRPLDLNLLDIDSKHLGILMVS